MGETIFQSLRGILQTSPNSSKTALIEVSVDYITGLDSNILHRFWNLSALLEVKIEISSDEDILFYKQYIAVGEETSSTVLIFVPQEAAMSKAL